MSDQIVLDYLRACGIAGTWLVANRLRIETADARTRLRRMERQGKVERDPRRTTKSNIVWRLPPPPPSVKEET